MWCAQSRDKTLEGMGESEFNLKIVEKYTLFTSYQQIWELKWAIIQIPNHLCESFFPIIYRFILFCLLTFCWGWSVKKHQPLHTLYANTHTHHQNRPKSVWNYLNSIFPAMKLIWVILHSCGSLESIFSDWSCHNMTIKCSACIPLKWWNASHKSPQYSDFLFSWWQLAILPHTAGNVFLFFLKETVYSTSCQWRLTA